MSSVCLSFLFLIQLSNKDPYGPLFIQLTGSGSKQYVWWIWKDSAVIGADHNGSALCVYVYCNFQYSSASMATRWYQMTWQAGTPAQDMRSQRKEARPVSAQIIANWHANTSSYGNEWAIIIEAVHNSQQPKFSLSLQIPQKWFIKGSFCHLSPSNKWILRLK